MRRTPLKPSLEGWKPPSLKQGCYSQSALETFLRGMETLSPPKIVLGLLNILETFLRGMETRRARGPAKEADNLETFLRGMETGIRRSASGCRPNLETFLRGMETGSARYGVHRGLVP